MSIIDSVPVLTVQEARRQIDIWKDRYELTEDPKIDLTASNDNLQVYYDEILQAVYLEYIGPEVSPEEIQKLMNPTKK